jgi:hypothetical protein
MGTHDCLHNTLKTGKIAGVVVEDFLPAVFQKLKIPLISL